jgi:hypothetical protein
LSIFSLGERTVQVKCCHEVEPEEDSGKGGTAIYLASINLRIAPYGTNSGKRTEKGRGDVNVIKDRKNPNSTKFDMWFNCSRNTTHSHHLLDNPHRLTASYKRRPLLILKPNTPAPSLLYKPVRALDDPHKRDDRKEKRGLMYGWT